MSIELRTFLFVSSVIIFLWTMRKIRKSQMKITYSLFWILITFIILLSSIFPHIPYFFTNILRIESPANFVFLLIISLLLIKLFGLSLSVSKLEDKLINLTQEVALREKKEKDAQD